MRIVILMLLLSITCCEPGRTLNDEESLNYCLSREMQIKDKEICLEAYRLKKACVK